MTTITHKNKFLDNLRKAGVAAILLCTALAGKAQQIYGPGKADGDPAMDTPVINTNPIPAYDYDKLNYAMIIGAAETKKGRIWACWDAGGDNDDAYFVMNSSDDKGKTWSKPRMVIDPHNTQLQEKRRILVGTVWVDPLNRLWVFFDQGMKQFDGRDGDWYTMCSNPDSDKPTWSTPVRFADGCTLNKPIVLKDGTWLLPVSLWNRETIRDPYKDAFHELDTLRMANVYASTDKGKSWIRRGGVLFPLPQFDEHHVLERKDGSLWMTARTRKGMMQSVSYDKGKTWEKPEMYQEHIKSRHFITRLKSGKILLVRHGMPGEVTPDRRRLMAFLSDDEGKTWQGGLMIDERASVSYPDGFQEKDGTINVIYDRNRGSDAEIFLARFKEEDVMAGKFESKGAQERMIVNKANAQN